MSANSDNVSRFRVSLAQWRPKLEGRMQQLARRVLITLAHEVIVGGTYGPGTPIDTGFARASWFLSLDNPARSGSGPVPPPPGTTAAPRQYGDGSEALNAIALNLTAFHLGQIAYLLNDASYIGALEYGLSKQAPAGMVRIVLSAAQGMVDDIAKNMANGGDGNVLGVLGVQ